MREKYTVEDVNDYINYINDMLKDSNQEELNIPETALTPEVADALGSSLSGIYFALRKKKDQEYEEKQKRQRYERGFADSDVWNMYDWFIKMARPMLQKLRNERSGSPATLGNNYYDEDGLMQNDTCHAEWDEVLDRMIFLLGEMDEDTCSRKNKYQEAWWKSYVEFDKKFDFDEDGLKTSAEKEKEQADSTKHMNSPEDEPNREDIHKLKSQWYDEELKLGEYRNQCKNEFFTLFSKYFWDLWD